MSRRRSGAEFGPNRDRVGAQQGEGRVCPSLHLVPPHFLLAVLALHPSQAAGGRGHRGGQPGPGGRTPLWAVTPHTHSALNIRLFVFFWGRQGDVDDKQAAVKMKMFGKLTRETLEWHPDKLLCKRFNVPNPFPGYDSDTPH